MPSLGACAWKEMSGPGACDAVAWLAFGVHVQVGEVAGAQGNEVTEGTEVRIEIGDRGSVASNAQRDRGRRQWSDHRRESRCIRRRLRSRSSQVAAQE